MDFRILIFLGSLFILLIFIAYFFYGLQPNNVSAHEIEFKINKGEGIREIGAHLSQESIIKSIFSFKFYSIVTGKAQKFQPGSYSLSNAMNIPQIVNVLTARTRSDVLVTIPEGSTLKDVDFIFSEAGIVQKNSITNFQLDVLKRDYPFLQRVNSLEGFLFPDSYYFELNTDTEKVVRQLLDEFSKKIWPLIFSSKDWYEKLILASLLEKEVPEFEDRRLVAGILLKRISIKIPLQVDATISYAKCLGQIKGCKEAIVFRKDISIESPYNTYKYLGWPPTPISNPGEHAIKAALSPQKSQYLYYLSASDSKETHFSKTLEEHNIKRAKYL